MRITFDFHWNGSSTQLQNKLSVGVIKATKGEHIKAKMKWVEEMPCDIPWCMHRKVTMEILDNA